MNGSPSSYRLFVAATVIAVAAACVQLVFLNTAFPQAGLSIARFGEVTGQRLLPGAETAQIVEPSWSEEGALRGMGVISYLSRAENDHYWICVPNAIGTVVFSLLALGVHAAVCAVIVRWSGNRLQTANHNRIPISTVCLWSCLWAPAGVTLLLVLRWFWAGVERGSITQRVVGQRYADALFGPFGRLAVLGGVVAVHLAIVLWAADRLRRREAEKEATTTGNTRTIAALVAMGVLLLLYPYLSGIVAHLLPTAIDAAIGQWSESTSLRAVADWLAPAP